MPSTWQTERGGNEARCCSNGCPHPLGASEDSRSYRGRPALTLASTVSVLANHHVGKRLFDKGFEDGLRFTLPQI